MKKIIGVGSLLILQAAALGVIWANETGELDKSNGTFINKTVENVSQLFKSEEKVEKETVVVGIPLNVNIIGTKVQLEVTNRTENGVISGELSGIPFFYYEGLEEYVYINGYMYELSGALNGSVYEVDATKFKKALSLKEQAGKYYYQEDSQLAKKRNFVLTNNEIVEILNEPNIPLTGANITKLEGQMPGAARTYRNGHHEGFDWYAEAIGTVITRETPVSPIFKGQIVRMDKDYVELETTYRETILAEAGEQKNTSPETLDKLRGRQVWVQSENGVLVRYAHLSSVSRELQVGDWVELDDVIGTVGNSGTSNGALNTDLDLHLHSDILIYGKNFWEYGDINDLNKEVIEIFDKALEVQKEIVE